MDELSGSSRSRRRKRRITRRDALLLSLAAPVASGMALKPGTGEPALIPRVEQIRARLRGSADGEEGGAPQDRDERLAQWYNWYNWGNWGGRVPRRVGRWRWPGR
jgi:hypothetical protein